MNPEFDTSDTEPEPARMLDLSEMRELLQLLTEFDVRGFEVPGLTLAFHERTEEERAAAKMTAAELKNEAKSTSSKPVTGFDPANTNTLGFKNPKLWPGTNGKRLTLAGNFE